MSDQPTPDEADRVAAVAWHELVSHGGGGYNARILAGLADDDPLVQAFAAHAKPHRDAAEKLAETLRKIAARKTSGPYAPGQIKAEHRAMIEGARTALAEWEASK